MRCNSASVDSQLLFLSVEAPKNVRFGLLLVLVLVKFAVAKACLFKGARP